MSWFFTDAYVYTLGLCVRVRVLRMKEWLGLFDKGHNPLPVPTSEVGGHHPSASRALTCIAPESSVL